MKENDTVEMVVETTDLEKKIENFDGRNKPEQMPVVQDAQPVNILEYAIEKKLEPEQIEKFWEIQKRIDASIAKKAYDKDKAALASEIVVVVKDMENKQYNSKYSSTDALVNGTRPLLGKHNFSHGWSYPEPTNDVISVTCTLTHSDGHSESVTIPGPPDKSGSKNPLQEMKSTRTYLKKETYEAVTGFVSSEGSCDDDGNASSKAKPLPKITEEQVKEIQDLLKQQKAPESEWLIWAKVKELKDMPLDNFDTFLTELKNVVGDK